MENRLNSLEGILLGFVTITMLGGLATLAASSF
jgi:hypothetical protein